MSERDNSDMDRGNILRPCAECGRILREGENVELSSGTYCQSCADGREEQPIVSDCGDAFRSYLDVTAPHFHVARGRRPGGAFLQNEAWEVRKVALRSVERCISRYVDTETDQ